MWLAVQSGLPLTGGLHQVGFQRDSGQLCSKELHALHTYSSTASKAVVIVVSGVTPFKPCVRLFAVEAHALVLETCSL